MNRSIWIGVILSTIVLGVTAGIIVHLYSDKKAEEATIQHVKEINRAIENQIVVETASKEDKTTPNTKLIFETYFNQCGHSNIKHEKIKSDEVNKNEEEIRSYYPRWQIKSFDSDEVKLYREENRICSKHYMVREKNGYIVIYSLDKDGNEELKKETEISTQYLPERDIDMLKKGIKVNSEEELEEVLSDYE